MSSLGWFFGVDFGTNSPPALRGLRREFGDDFGAKFGVDFDADFDFVLGGESVLILAPISAPNQGRPNQEKSFSAKKIRVTETG